MIKDVKNPQRRIACYVFFGICAALLLAQIIVCGVNFSRMNPWFFHGKVIALGYIVTTLLTMILSILALINFSIRSLLDFYELEKVGLCCSSIITFFECFFSSCTTCCCCGGCFVDIFSWIAFFVGWIVFILGVVDTDKEFKKGICSGQYSDLVKGVKEYLEKHPDKTEKFYQWRAKYTYRDFCHNSLNPLIAILIIEFIMQFVYSILLGLCDCCGKKEKISNSVNEQDEQNNAPDKPNANNATTPL